MMKIGITLQRALLMGTMKQNGKSKGFGIIQNLGFEFCVTLEI